MGGTEFERELRGILEARDDVMEKVVRSCSELEKANYELVREVPFMVIRAAGSFGVDLVAYRHGVFLPIEVKSSAKKRLWLGSERHVQQVDSFHDACRMSGVIPVYAFRLKKQRGDAWRIFTAGDVDPTGMSRLLFNTLPKVTRTKGDRVVLPWEEGMPLNEFLAYVHSLLEG